MRRLKQSVLDVPHLSYASADKTPEELLDLGEGDNPYGFDTGVLTRVNLTEPALWAGYPHTRDLLKQDLIRWWNDAVALAPEQIHLTAGSIDAIYKIHALFDPKQGGVLGVEPQFSDTVMNARVNGFAYTGLPLTKDSGFLISADELISSLTEDISILYLDNPHNPTGQTASFETLRKLLDRAKETGSYVISDEAYGDYVGREQSAAVLLKEYDNLIVIRSFSKGWGFAGARCGYLLLPSTLNRELEKLSNPYVVPGPVGALLHELLRSDAHLNESRRKIRATKQKLKAQLGAGLFMSVTDDQVPICLLYTDDPGFHLGNAFLEEGVRVIFGENYYGLDNSSVRVLMPKEADEARLFAAVRRIGERIG